MIVEQLHNLGWALEEVGLYMDEVHCGRGHLAFRRGVAQGKLNQLPMAQAFYMEYPDGHHFIEKLAFVRGYQKGWSE
jgi:hypothetical protein